jgi:O-antigen/teichoic acid export membrane protein
MTKLIKKIFTRLNKSSSSHYLIATFFQKGLVFFTIPIFTRLLSVEEYGILTIFQSLLNILIVFTTLGIRGAIVRFYHDKDIKFFRFYTSAFVFFLIYNCIFSIGSYFASSPVGEFFNIPPNLIFVSALIAGFSTFYWFYLSYLQASGQSKKYAVTSVINTLLVLALAIIWILQLNQNKYFGRVYAQLVINFVFLLFVVYKSIAFFKEKISTTDIKKFIRFGIPLVPHMLAGFLLAFSDRIIINQLVDSESTGIYSLAYNIGMIVHVVIMSLNKSWTPFFYKAMNNGDYQKIANQAVKLSKIVIITALFIVLLSKEILTIFAPKSYFDSLYLIPIIAVSYLFLLLYTLYSSYSYYLKRTELISVFTIIAVVINILLNYILIPVYDYQVAAITTLLSYFVLFVAHFINAKYILKQKNLFKLQKALPLFFIVLVVSAVAIYLYSINFSNIFFITVRYFLLIIIAFLSFRKEIFNFVKTK